MSSATNILTAIGLAAAIVVAPGPARASQPTRAADAAADSGRTDADVAARLEFVMDALETGSTYANVWYWGWTGGQLAAAAVFAGLAYAQRDDPGNKANHAVSAVQSFTGGAVLVFFPLDAAFATMRLEHYHDDTPAQRRKKLAAAERQLTLAAEGEQLGRHWINHVLGIAVAAAGGLLLTFAYAGTDWRDGLINFAVGVAITEASIWSQPMRAVRDRERYDQLDVDQLAARHSRPPVLRFVPYGAGASLVLSF